MYVVEFQKRGLPHAHIAVRLQGRQPRTPDEIDTYISAEIPPNKPDGEPWEKELRELVLRNMIHRRCVPERCFKQRKRGTPRQSCKYGFPYALQGVTTIDDNGKVLHRRRNNGDEVVVSYNPAMLLRYKCHINVQYAESIKMIKYIRKYMCKVQQCNN